METGYRTLGKKTFVLFLLERTQAAAVFFIITIGLAILENVGVFQNVVGQNLNQYANLATIISLAMFVLSFLFAFSAAWLKYATYKFILDENSLKIRRGILSKEEIAIPYNRIENVDIERSFYYQTMGVSRIVILTAGHEDEKDAPDEAEGVLPALDENMATSLRDELLRRASIQKVSETK